MLSTSSRRYGVAATAAILFALVLSACSSPANTGSGNSSAGTDSAALAALAADAKAAVDAQSQTQAAHPPTDGPTAVAGKKIMIITCASNLEGCARQGQGAADAAKALGWTSTTIDGNNQPATQSEAILNAITQKYDGVVLTSIGSQSVQSALQQAKDAGLPVVCQASTDSAHLCAAEVPDEKLWYDQGYLQGQNLYELSGGKLNLLMFRFPSDPASDLRYEGTMKFIEDCAAAGGDCVAKEQAFTGDQIGPGLASLANSTIVTSPDVNWVWAPFDAATPYIAQGLGTAGKSDLRIVGFDANAQTTEMIRQGKGEISTLALPLEWIGWGGADALNRIFAGVAVADSGVASKILVDSNLPASGSWTGDMDFEAAYEKTWK